jgi:hypothetical protein
MVADENGGAHAPEEQHADDGHEHGPTGQAAVEPDSPPMRLLTVTVVVISIGVIGAGIGLAQYLGMSTRAQQADKVGNVAAVYQTQKAADTTSLNSFGYDAEKKHFEVPLAQAKAFLVANPTKVGSKAMWNLEPLTKPEPKEKK